MLGPEVNGLHPCSSSFVDTTQPQPYGIAGSTLDSVWWSVVKGCTVPSSIRQGQIHEGISPEVVGSRSKTSNTPISATRGPATWLGFPGYVPRHRGRLRCVLRQ